MSPYGAEVITAVFLKDTLDAANNDAELLGLEVEVVGVRGCGIGGSQ